MEFPAGSKFAFELELIEKNLKPSKIKQKMNEKLVKPKEFVI